MSEESLTTVDKQPDTADHTTPPQQADPIEDPTATGDNNQAPQQVDVDAVDDVDKPNATPAPQDDPTAAQATDSKQPDESPAKPADADSVELTATAVVDAAPVDEAAKEVATDITADMSKSVATVRSADSIEPVAVGDFLRKSGRVVIAEASGSSAEASPHQDSADGAAPFSLKSKGSKIDQKEEARKQAHARRRGHVRAASMSESVKSLVIGARGVEASPSIDKIKRDGSSASSASLSTSSPMSTSSSSLASSSSGSKGGDSVTKQPHKEKKDKEKKKSKWDKVRGLKGGAARDKSDTISEDVIAAAKREREAGSSIVGMTATSTSTKKASDSLRPHLMKHNSEKLDRMLVRRPSYKVLVEQGYIKEWGDAADLAGAASAGKSPSPRGPKRSPTFKLADEDDDGGGAAGGKDDQQAQGEDSDEETPRKSLIDNVQLLPTDSLWHVERGSKRVRTHAHDTPHELALTGKLDLIRTLCRERTWPSRTITSSCPTTRSSSSNEVRVESSCGACSLRHSFCTCVVSCDVLYMRRIVVCRARELLGQARASRPDPHFDRGKIHTRLCPPPSTRYAAF